MNFFIFLCFLSAILINLTVIAAQNNEYRFHSCGSTGNFTNNTAYGNNLNQLLSSLSSNATSSNGFKNITIGRDPDTVYGSFLCRGDLTNQTCQACVEEARKSIIQRCPNQKESILWYDYCMLRYSNRSFFSLMQTAPGVYLWNQNNITDRESFNRVVGNLMENLVTEAEAAVGSSSSRPFFSTKDANFTSFQKVYGLVQCNPDITRRDCEVCLRDAVGNIPICCDGKQGGRVLYASCNLRYEVYPFYETRTTAPAPSPPVLPPPLTNSTNPEEVVCIVVGLATNIGIIYMRIAPKKAEEPPESSPLF